MQSHTKSLHSLDFRTTSQTTLLTDPLKSLPPSANSTSALLEPKSNLPMNKHKVAPEQSHVTVKRLNRSGTTDNMNQLSLLDSQNNWKQNVDNNRILSPNESLNDLGNSITQNSHSNPNDSMADKNLNTSNSSEKQTRENSVRVKRLSHKAADAESTGRAVHSGKSTASVRVFKTSRVQIQPTNVSGGPSDVMSASTNRFGRVTCQLVQRKSLQDGT